MFGDGSIDFDPAEEAKDDWFQPTIEKRIKDIHPPPMYDNCVIILVKKT